MMPLENEGNSHTATDITKPRLVTIAMTVVLLLETCLILGWVLAKADHGLDLSDESFYLLCIESPGEYPISVSEFGRVLSIPHAALGANLVSFRQLNLVATYGLALVVAYQLLGKWLGNLGCTGFMRLAVSATFALPSLTVMSYWLITPSYNSLNGIAYLLVCVAVFSEPKTDHGRLRAAILIGFGGYLSFMAKPTSAAALGLMVFVLVWVIERWNWKSLVVAIFTALFCLLVTMYLFAGGPVAYVNELRETIAVDMDPTHSFSKLLQWNSPHLDKRWRIVFGASCLILFVLLRFRQRKKMVAFNGWAAKTAVCSMIALGGLAIVAMWSDFQGISIGFLEHRSDEYGRKERYLFLSTLSVVVLAVFFRQVDRRRFATACFLFWLPYAFAFGTNINYWDKGATVAFYWVISLVVAISAVPLKQHQMSYVLVIASFLPLFCILDLQNAYTQPYRQRAFNENVMKPVIVGSGETELLMVEETADLIDVLRQSASAAGFEPGTPVLDLSGQGIGLIYMIGGKNFPGAWSAQGTPWAQKSLRQGLVRRRNDGLDKLWILKKENWENSNSEQVLEAVGLSMADFVEVVRIPTTAEVGNLAPRLQEPEQTDVRLVLYKRKSDDKPSDASVEHNAE